jgi:hypothetical protein
MRRLALAVLIGTIAVAAGCGGGDASSAEPSTANVSEIKRAVEDVASKCIDVSFEQGGPSAATKIRLAVDRLIRNFQKAPDEHINLGGIKATTPRHALETALTFLENEGITEEPCNAAAADQVHSALAAR